MAASDWQLQSMVVAALVGPTVVAGLLAYAVATAPNIKGWVIALACGLIAPVSILVFAWLTPLTKPDPRSFDGPAYVLAGLILWALVLTPACLVSSSVAVWLKRRSWSRQSSAVR